MFFKKLNIYIIISVFIIIILLALATYAFTDDSIYVWSSTLEEVPTNASPEEENTLDNNSPTNDTRKFFRNNLWKCYSYGTKHRNYFI